MKKRREVFHWFKNKKNYIYMLQEAHCTNFVAFGRSIQSVLRSVISPTRQPNKGH